MKEKGCSVCLYSGIGNVIQGIPFAFEMKKYFETVTGFIHRLDFPEETIGLLQGVLDKIYKNRQSVPKKYKIFKYPKHDSRPEFKSWFIDNKRSIPQRFCMSSINFKKISKKHSVVIWPECKNNWVCKRWPYWTELAKKFDDVAIIGEEKTPKFSSVTDYRGKLSFLEIGGLIKNADMFIGNDGGISHFAAALGTKTFIIFGGTDPIKNLPPSLNGGKMLSKNLKCQPCQFNGMKKDGILMLGCDERECLNNFSVDEVLKQLKN